MAAAGPCLSDLSDDLLRHILSFAPTRDTATTAVLSRRWLQLWRTSGDVYLDSRSFNNGGRCSSSSPEDQQEEREAFVFLRGAERVLAAAQGHVRRVTFVITEGNRREKPSFLDIKHCAWESEELIGALVSIPAARRVEELQIEAKPRDNQFKVSFGSLPSEALRVLRIVKCGCTLTAPPHGDGATAAAVLFPMLEDLHLQNCSIPLVDLQSIIDAAPKLSTLHLAYTHFSCHSSDEKSVGRLTIPAVTALVFADCRYGFRASLELDVPRLQTFTYRGCFERTNLLSLKSTSKVIQVDLQFTNESQRADRASDRASFWRFVHSFNATKVLKLKLDFTMDHLALDDTESQDELLGGLSLRLLDQLEVEAQYMPEFETSMVMLANLLHSCPMVHDLRLKLSKWQGWYRTESSIDKEAGVQFDRSVNGFRNHRNSTVSSLAVGEDEGDNYYQASGIVPGLTGERSFSCLQHHLKRVSLHFFMDEPNCLGVQLARFFTENAIALQEMHIDDGCHEMLDHVNPTVRRWIAKTDKGNNKLNVKD